MNDNRVYPYIEFMDYQQAKLPESGYGAVEWITITRTANYASHQDMQRTHDSVEYFNRMGGHERNETNADGLLRNVSISPDFTIRIVREYKPNTLENGALMGLVTHNLLPAGEKYRTMITSEIQKENERQKEALGFGFLLESADKVVAATQPSTKEVLAAAKAEAEAKNQELKSQVQNHANEHDQQDR